MLCRQRYGQSESKGLFSLNNQEYIQIHDDNVMHTYGRFPVVIDHARGACAWDADGKKYIDFGSGIGTNSLGYCDEGWVRAVEEQLTRVQHVSNYFYTPSSALFAQKLMQITGYSKVFLCNSGAEANECALKIARKYSFDTYAKKERSTIITLKNSFHGRTVTTLSATGQDEFHNYFFPFTEGFRFAQANHMESVLEQFDDTVCAVMVEFIQGEGGVLPLEPEFVAELSKFCRDHDLLLIGDEVQTGVGRTGTFYCCEQYGVKPDVLTSAKGLGGGLPIGACLCREGLEQVLTPGTHGSTFGGNPVVCAGGIEVLNRLSTPGFLEEVRKKGEYLRSSLLNMSEVQSVRGLGLMLGADLKTKAAKKVCARCVEEGLFTLTAKTSMRFLPPLTITYDELDEGLAILRRVLAE